MKKIYLIAILFVASSMSVFAQKGEKAAGVHLNFGTTASSVGLGAKFQYGLTDVIRLEPSLTYYFGGSGMFDITVNGHYVFFDVAPKINVYPLVGLGFDLCRYKWYGYDEDSYYGDEMPKMKTYKETDSAFKFNFGCGGEYGINDKIAVSLELKYEIITGGFSQFFAGLGVKFNI